MRINGNQCVHGKDKMIAEGIDPLGETLPVETDAADEAGEWRAGRINQTTRSSRTMESTRTTTNKTTEKLTNEPTNKPMDTPTTAHPKRAGLREAAAIVGLSVSELYRGARSGRWPCMRLGDERGKLWFDIAMLNAAIEREMLANMVVEEQPMLGKIRRVELR
jgi:hypothetical protein